MARGIDVYQILRTFAQKNGLSEVSYKSFAQALQRQAKLSDQAEPLFRDLSLNPDIVLVPKLYLLAKERKLVLQTAGNEILSISLPERFIQAYIQEYSRIDENPEVPFPDDDLLDFPVPGEWIQNIAIESDLGPLFEASKDSSIPLYRITFPEGIKALVLPTALLSDRLLEFGVQKLRQYLRKGANKEYVYNKLMYAFPGKEGQLKDSLGAVMSRPFDAVKVIVRSDSDFTYAFWAYFLSAVKKDVEKKKEKTIEDVSFLQSVYICEFFVNHYKAKAQRQIELDNALKALDQALRKAPYYFAIEDIVAFRDGKGKPLLGKITQEELDGRLREKSTRAVEGSLPELLVISGGNRRVYVATDKALFLAVKLLGEARADIRSRLIDKWKCLLEEFSSCPAMNDDQAFIQELGQQVQDRFPILDGLFGSHLLPIVRDQLASRGELHQDLDRLFYKGDLIPLNELLNLDRKGLLSDARMLLPFWYLVPIFSSIAKMIHRIGKDREARAAARSREAAQNQEEAALPTAKAQRGQTSKERRAEFEAQASRVALELLPKGYSLEEYLRELEGRWNTMLNPEAKRNLSYDVDCLARDYLRSVVRTMGPGTLTLERVKNLGSTLADSPTLLKIKNHQALETYLQLYMLKILGAKVQNS